MFEVHAGVFSCLQILILVSWRVNDYPEQRNSITSGQSAQFLCEPMDRSKGGFLNLKSQKQF